MLRLLQKQLTTANQTLGTYMRLLAYKVKKKKDTGLSSSCAPALSAASTRTTGPLAKPKCGDTSTVQLDELISLYKEALATDRNLETCFSIELGRDVGIEVNPRIQCPGACIPRKTHHGAECIVCSSCRSDTWSREIPYAIPTQSTAVQLRG